MLRGTIARGARVSERNPIPRTTIQRYYQILCNMSREDRRAHSEKLIADPTPLVPALIRPGAMGMGDVKLAVLLGAALGRDVLSALTIGFVAYLDGSGPAE